MVERTQSFGRRGRPEAEREEGPRSDHDGATPHSTGLATLGLLRVASLSGRDDLAEVARAVLRSHSAALERAHEAFPTLARAALIDARGVSVAVIVGDPSAEATHALATRARRVLLPEDGVLTVAPDTPPPDAVDASWLAGRTARDGRPTAYLCRGVECSAPILDPDELQGLAASLETH